MCHSTAPPTSALNATAQQTPMETTRSAQCGGNGDRIARHNAIRDVLYTSVCVCVTCIDSFYVFNHRAILAEWFKGTDSKNDALVLSMQVGVQRKLTSHLTCVPVCRGGVHPYRGRDW